MSEPFDELASAIGFILGDHVRRLRGRSRLVTRMEDWELRDAIAKEIADHLRRGWVIEKPPPKPGHSIP